MSEDQKVPQYMDWFAWTLFASAVIACAIAGAFMWLNPRHKSEAKPIASDEAKPILSYKDNRAFALCTVTTESNQSVLGWFPMEQAYRPSSVITVYRTNFAGCVFLPAAGSTVSPHYTWPQ